MVPGLLTYKQLWIRTYLIESTNDFSSDAKNVYFKSNTTLFYYQLAFAKDVYGSVSLITQRETWTYLSNGNTTVDIKENKFHSI